MMLVWNNWSKHVKWLSVPQQNLSDILQFSKLCVLQIINTIVSIWCENMLRYYFVLGHYLFLKVHSLLLGTDNICGQISEQVSTPKRYYIVYIFLRQIEAIVCLYQLNFFLDASCDWGAPAITGEYSLIFPYIFKRSWENYLEDNIRKSLHLKRKYALVLNMRRIINTNSHHLAWKYTQIFVLGYYLFL